MSNLALFGDIVDRNTGDRLSVGDLVSLPSEIDGIVERRGQVVFVDTIADLKAIDAPENERVYFVADPKRGGLFTYRIGDQSSSISSDGFDILYSARGADPTGTLGCFVRFVNDSLYVDWSGAQNDGTDEAGNNSKIQRCVDLSIAHKIRNVRFGEGEYAINQIDLPHAALSGGGVTLSNSVTFMPKISGTGQVGTWLRCFTDADSDVGIFHAYMTDTSQHVHTSLEITDMTIDGVPGRPAISFEGIIFANVRRVTFEKSRPGILYHNKAGDNFTEYCVAHECEFGFGCRTAIEYRVANGVDSFHGSGMLKCIVNELPAATTPTVLIGPGALPYNAPLDFQVWKYNQVELIRSETQQGGINTYGNITIETFGGDSVTWPVCYATSGNGWLTHVGSINELWNNAYLLHMWLAEQCSTQHLDANTKICHAQYKPIHKTLTVPVGQSFQTTSFINYSVQRKLFTVSVSAAGTGYDYLGVYNLMYDSGTSYAVEVTAHRAAVGGKALPVLAVTSSGDIQVNMPDSTGYTVNLTINDLGGGGSRQFRSS